MQASSSYKTRRPKNSQWRHRLQVRQGGILEIRYSFIFTMSKKLHAFSLAV